ncbi:MAG: Ig-like domain-containing protein, partial [Clostridia bacterium]
FTRDGITAKPAQGDKMQLTDNGAKFTVNCNGKTSTEDVSIQVTAKKVTAIAVTANPTKLAYIEEQAMDLTGLAVTLTFNDATTKTGVAYDALGTYGVTVTPAHGKVLATSDATEGTITLSGGSATSATINGFSVAAKKLTEITVKTAPTLAYFATEKLDLSKTVVTLAYDNGKHEDVAFKDFATKQVKVYLRAGTDAGNGSEIANDTAMTVADHNGKLLRFGYTCVDEKTVDTAALSVKQAQAKIGDKFYEHLADAIAAVTGDKPIVIIVQANIDLSATLTIGGAQKIMLTLGGFTLTERGNLPLITVNGTLWIGGGKLVGAANQPVIDNKSTNTVYIDGVEITTGTNGVQVLSTAGRTIIEGVQQGQSINVVMTDPKDTVVVPDTLAQQVTVKTGTLANATDKGQATSHAGTGAEATTTHYFSAETALGDAKDGEVVKLTAKAELKKETTVNGNIKIDVSEADASKITANIKTEPGKATEIINGGSAAIDVQINDEVISVPANGDRVQLTRGATKDGTLALYNKADAKQTTNLWETKSSVFVDKGAEMTIKATANSGYSFSGYTIKPTAVTITKDAFTASEPCVIGATFSSNYYPPTPVAVTGVKLDKRVATVKVGETLTLVATVEPADANNKSLTWTSASPAIATVAGGVVTGVAEGESVITVTTADGKFTATCTVTVSKGEKPPKPPVEDGKLVLDGLIIGKGVKTKTSNLLPPGFKGNVTWTTGDQQVMQIVKSKKTFFFKGVKLGNTTLTATFADGTSQTIPVEVVEKALAVSKVTLGKAFKMKPTETRQLAPVVKPATAKDGTLRYFSGNPAVATVKDGLITAKKGGKARIIAVSTSGILGYVDVTVNKFAPITDYSL